MVRLKGETTVSYRMHMIAFQFLYGAIKGEGFIGLRDFSGNFNSCMVRLKARCLPCNRDGLTYFNSCMVRLKDLCSKGREVTEKFQFLYGAIKGWQFCNRDRTNV
ncbi:hypothetical protein SAMN05421747_1223 [Parapedobacter composti]|uniref:Uncharacterized protein n=1 Tax=Parapedobacter composti TaxID=623281 RepID=A0A1I1LSD0_9SPHI|nr:hypothetical protein SAMN05421747_1223 [Parapedobacter composti]